MATHLNIRPAVVEDADVIFNFVTGLIQDHLPGQRPWTSVDQLRQDGFGDDPLYEALIAESHREPVGFVSFFRGYAGWRGKPMGIIHALYVSPDWRGDGVGRALVSAVARIARNRGWCRIELFVEEGRPAVEFYHSIGMRDLHHRHFRLDGAQLQVMSDEFPSGKAFNPKT